MKNRRKPCGTCGAPMAASFLMPTSIIEGTIPLSTGVRSGTRRVAAVEEALVVAVESGDNVKFKSRVSVSSVNAAPPTHPSSDQ